MTDTAALDSATNTAADPPTLTIYESVLWVNPLSGRWSPGRGWAAQPYRVHQRLSMAFPSDERKKNDQQGIQPYKPEDFLTPRPNGQGYGVARSQGGFLFRIEGGPEPHVVVRSVIEPDWNYAFQNAPELLRDAEPIRFRQRTYRFDADPQKTKFAFRLLANPTMRATPTSPPAGGYRLNRKPGEKRPRHALREESGQRDWLMRKAAEAGFAVEGGFVVTPLGDVRHKEKRWFSVLFEGTLTVADLPRFADALVQGIGSGKAFGFGLLSLAPG